VNNHPRYRELGAILDELYDLAHASTELATPQ